ncbi:Uma2 family endonuclease [Streptomyces olivoreticuli]
MNPKHLELIEEARRIAPENVKVEFSGEIIIMQAAPSAIHQRNLDHVARQFAGYVPADHFASQNSGLSSPQTGKSRTPDLTILPEDAPEGENNEIPAELALIAVEIVSPSNPENDWVGKVRDYPLMGIALYLIVDAREKIVTLFSEPENGRYRQREDATFGEDIHIPAPFSFTLNTSRLLQYR